LKKSNIYKKHKKGEIMPNLSNIKQRINNKLLRSGSDKKQPMVNKSGTKSYFMRIRFKNSIVTQSAISGSALKEVVP